MAGENGDITFSNDKENDELDENVDEPENTPEGPRADPLQGSMMMMMKTMMESFTAPILALAKAQTDGGTTSMTVSAKRKREEEEEEIVKSLPVLIDIESHHLKDDAHNVLDWKAREWLRPYNGHDQELYWSKRPRKCLPVIEDLEMAHLTKAPINPNVIAKLHDRGADMAAKQWLASNYSVEGKGGKIRADNDRSAGAFVLDYSLAKGPWEATDAIHNYTVVLRMVR